MPKKTIILIVVLGVVLMFTSFVATSLFEVGEFDSSFGKYSIPVGFPLRFLKDKEVEGILPPGASLPQEFQWHLFFLDLLFWIGASALIVFLARWAWKRFQQNNTIQRYLRPSIYSRKKD